MLGRILEGLKTMANFNINNRVITLIYYQLVIVTYVQPVYISIILEYLTEYQGGPFLVPLKIQS